MKMKMATGHRFNGIAISDTEAVVQCSLNQLEAMGLRSPYISAKTSFNNTAQDQLPFKDLRFTVQRAWDAGRSARADLYCNYLDGIHKGRHVGATPPVTLYIPTAAIVGDDGTIAFPYRTAAIAIDGETQLEARFRNREADPETGDEPFAAVVHHSIDELEAVQILHDFNRYAHPIPESKLGARNTSGGISQTITTALSHAGLHAQDLNRIGTQGTQKQVSSFSQCMFFVAGYALGQRGLAVNASAQFDHLNRPGTPALPDACVRGLVSIYNMCRDTDEDKRMAKRKMPNVFYQVAGVCASEGMDLEALDWDAAFAAEQASKPVGRGGQRPSRAQRQGLIYEALTGSNKTAAAAQ